MKEVKYGKALKITGKEPFASPEIPGMTPLQLKVFCTRLTVMCQMYGVQIVNDPIIMPMPDAQRTCQFEYRANKELTDTAGNPYLRYVFIPGEE